jgi:membrane fusion protein (multidrug efflux system)
MNAITPKSELVAETITETKPESAASVVAELKASLPQKPRRVSKRKFILGAAALIAVVAGTYYGQDYTRVGRFLESTDDAYVKADFTIVAPKISGYIGQVLVEDNQPVKAGDAVAKIDDRDFQAALDQAKANVAAAQSQIRSIDAQLQLQNSVIDQSQADISSAKAAVTFAVQDQARYQKLMNDGWGTVQRSQQAETTLRQSQAALTGTKAGLTAAQEKIVVLKTQRENAEAERDRDLAAERQAELNLSYTTILAPVDGVVGARSLRVGQYVQAGTQLMAVVPLHSAYIVANFKETQLSHMRKGQPVTITIDSYPDLKLSGHVDSVSPASGLEFALLPPDNATGNFTKIVQRVPVKIVIDENGLSGDLLKAGMSVEPTVNTKGQNS